MGKTYKDKPDKWRRDRPVRAKGPKNGTLNHVNKPSKPFTLPDDRYDAHWNHH